MPAKLKVEWGEFCFWKKLLMQGVLSIPVAYVHRNHFLTGWPEASVGEFIIYSLTQENYFLILFPFLCLVRTSEKNHAICRYPILLRYRTENEFFVTRILAKAVYSMAALLLHIGALAIVGHSLPAAPQRVFVCSENPVRIIVMQFFNLLCYVCTMILLYELFLNVAGNAMLGVMLTLSIALMNLLAVKLMLYAVVAWTPWGNIAYRLYGRERPEYRFYGIYWTFWLALLFFLAEKLNGRKDYVFEEICKMD